MKKMESFGCSDGIAFEFFYLFIYLLLLGLSFLFISPPPSSLFQAIDGTKKESSMTMQLDSHILNLRSKGSMEFFF